MTSPKKPKPIPDKGKGTWAEQLLAISREREQAAFPLNYDRLKVRRLEWLGDELITSDLADDLTDRINEAYEAVDNSDVKLCRAGRKGERIQFRFYDSRHEILYYGEIIHDNIREPGSFRIWQPGNMDSENDKADQIPLRPRWAEEARPKKQVKLRLEPDLISEVESAATSSGMTRNDWIEESIRKALATGKPKPK